MTKKRLDGTRRSRRGSIVAAVVTIVLTAGLAAVLFAGRVSPSADRPAVTRYLETIRPLGADAGRIAEQEIKPKLRALREGSVTPAQFQADAGRWLKRFASIRASFAQAPRVKRLNAVAAAYDEALAAYQVAINGFVDAAKNADTGARDAALSKAASNAERADRLYDAAREALKRVLREVGAEAPSTF